jgi:ATP-dependent helicase/nuclease subunit A
MTRPPDDEQGRLPFPGSEPDDGAAGDEAAVDAADGGVDDGGVDDVEGERLASVTPLRPHGLVGLPSLLEEAEADDATPARPVPAPAPPVPAPRSGSAADARVLAEHIHADADARHRIEHDLDETLFVEAGAGSGKTRALVGRIVALVTSGAATLPEIAAITFTEKAAAELRDRVRRSLAEAGTEARRRGDHEVAARCAAAVDEVDSAAIGTLHAFAQRILSEHPIEAGLPPRVEVLDEVASAVAFEDRWSSFVDVLLDEPSVERSLLLVTAAGVRMAALRAVAVAFDENWDLALDQAPSEAPEPPMWEHRLDALLDELDAVCAHDARCIDASDRLLSLLADLQSWGVRARRAGDEFSRLALLSTDGGRPRPKAKGKGRKTNWPEVDDLDGLRATLDDIAERADAIRNDVALAALWRLAVELRRFTLDAAAERRAAGELEFHDLLVMARQMLRDPERGPTVRAALHQRYRRLLIDEFQDTDPIQVELAVLIASPPGGNGEPPGPAPAPAWDEAEPEPGHLFFVGDPKQSIYRFRRADISLFLQAAARFGAGGGRVSLTTNHRSGRSVIDAVNHVFGRLIQPAERGGLPSQPAYEPFDPVRPDAPVGPAVSVLGRAAHEDKPRAAELRTRESIEVAAAVRRALDDGWQVDASPDWRTPTWRPARARDITILVPTRTVLPALEDALTAVGVAYRAESASLVYASRLIRDLLLTLRAAEDPTDELSVVAALRSPLFACGDDDLLVYRRQLDGRFDPTRPRPETVPPDNVVAEGLDYLAQLHDDRLWHPPSELIDRIVADRRLLELGEAEGRARDLWRRVRFVADQARAWSEATNGTLRQYLDWIRQQTAEGARVAEAVLPETDDDAVRIMTIHAAKGLQFPITVVTGLTTRPQRWPAPAEVAWPPGQPCLITIGRKVTSEAFEAWKPVDEQMSHDERVRLLYVACTRAQDHLVVSLHRSVRQVDEPSRLTSAELFHGAAAELLPHLPDAAPADATAPTVAPAAVTPPPPASAAAATDRDDDGLLPFEEWRDQRDRALATSGRPRTLAATALTDDGRPDAADDPGLRKRPRDLDLPPWQKGRYGTAVGRAVHGVLQTIDLATGEGLEAAVSAQSAAEGVMGLDDRIRALVTAALRTPSVIEAAAAAHWRELYVGVPLGGGRLLEGYVDLLYRRPPDAGGGLVVVDYKTGPAGVDVDLGPLVERYRLQGASYALAVEQATGEPVAEVRFAFLTPEGAVERSLPDLPGAVAHVRRLAESGDPSLVAVG